VNLFIQLFRFQTRFTPLPWIILNSLLSDQLNNFIKSEGFLFN
jgi:hypothetical protein